MNLQLDDTIVALSSASGPAARAIVRLSGPAALALAETVFHSPTPLERKRRMIHAGFLALSEISSPVPADLYLFPAPRSYTGQMVVELHLISSPPLVEQLIADLLAAGARAAQPGEYTLRAFLAGKLDLPQAEAVLGTIEAGDRDELQSALQQLAGGVSRPLDGLRDDLLNLLADLEASLDFVEEDIEFVNKREVLLRLTKALAQVTLVQRQVRDRSVAGRPFRVALVGPPNAGKSCLFNALTGGKALVSPVPGTTRDYLVARVDWGGMPVELIDTAGLRPPGDAMEGEAQAIGRDMINQVDLILHCRAADATGALHEQFHRDFMSIATKVDLAPPPPGVLATSAMRGDGLSDLTNLIALKARARSQRGLAPSLSRCRHHVDACLESLQRVHKAVVLDEPADLVASELRAGLDQLGALTGAIYTDDLLDRVFSRFCIGK